LRPSDDRRGDSLPRVGSVLAVCAHPDDESFGLGSALGAFSGLGAAVSVLCFTHGEASTLGVAEGDLHHLRAAELGAAARVLSVGRVALLDYPDGRLAEQPIQTLARNVQALVREVHPDILLAFDSGGITGHQDHQWATQAALVAADAADLPVLGWVLAEDVAGTLNAEFRASFVGRRAAEIDFLVQVDRTRQRAAIACHHSQSVDNPVLWRRLELQGAVEAFRWLRRGKAV